MASRVKIGGEIKDAVTRDLVNACASLGYKAGMDAYRNHSYKHRTYALHDSYGSAVYLDGVLIPETIRYINRSRQSKNDYRGWRGSKDLAANPRDFFTGRQALLNYLKNPPRMSKKNHITILVVAAQWYASILEGKKNGNRKYIVLRLSDVQESIKTNFNKYISPVMKKYGLEKFTPEIARGLGVDYTGRDTKRS